MGPGLHEEVDARRAFAGASAPALSGARATLEFEDGTGGAPGRVAASVPGCAFVIVGTLRDRSSLGVRRGDTRGFSIIHHDSVYRFRCRVIDVLERPEGDFIAWAVRTAFPDVVQIVQRRAEPRVSLEQAGVPVYLRRGVQGPSAVRGQGINLSSQGLLAEFAGVGIVRSGSIQSGDEARIIFGVPANGKLKPEDIEALSAFAHRPTESFYPTAVETPTGGTILDIPAQVVRLMTLPTDGGAVAFRFEGVPEPGRESIRQFVQRRLDEMS